jgi:Secretion system C-terminal sorting domain
MKKTLLSLAFIAISAFSFGQFSTGTISSTGLAVKIDTTPTDVTLTITAPATVWFGIGFGGLTMTTATDMFIWSSSSDRDYTSGGQVPPSVDQIQNWTISADNVASGFRTIVATRPLASSGDYTFINNASSIQVIIAAGSSTTFGFHAGKTWRTLTRSALGVEDFSLNSASIYPNPSSGVFNVQTKTGLEKINVYSQIGAFVKTIEVENGILNTEINLKGLQAGVYLLELQKGTEKSWKKIVLE